jgi:hypothetical protein
VSCIYTRTWPKYPDAEISDRANATSPAAAAHTATSPAAAAVPAAAAAVAAVAAVASTCLQSWPDFSSGSLSNASDAVKRKWLADNCNPQPKSLLLLLRKAAVLFDTEFPAIKRSVNKDSDEQQLMREAIKALGPDKTDP